MTYLMVYSWSTYCYNAHGAFSTVLLIYSLKKMLSQISRTIKHRPCIVLHGGAGWVDDARAPYCIEGVEEAAKAGFAILSQGGTALQAVEAAVRYVYLYFYIVITTLVE